MTVKTGKQNEIKLEPKKKTELDYIALFDEYYKDFNVQGMHDLFESKEHTGKSSKIGRIRKPIFKVKITGCPSCKHPVRVYDEWRGETVCEHCGVVVSTYNYEDGDYNPDELPWNDGRLRKDELKVIGLERKRKERITKQPTQGKVKHQSNTQNWRKKQYFFALEIISSQLQMTENQKEIVKEVIDTYPLNLFHGWLGHRTIITGLCRYVLCLQGRGRELRFSRSVFKENNLNSENYEKISKQIKQLRVFSH